MPGKVPGLPCEPKESALSTNQSGQPRWKHPLLVEVLFWALCVILSYYYWTLRFDVHFNEQYDGATLKMLTEGTAKIPIQHRVLIPWCVRAVLELDLSRDPIAIYKSIEFVLILAVLLAYRHQLRFFFPNRGLSSLLCFSLFYILLFTFVLPVLSPYFFPYDTAALLVITLGLTFLHQRQYGRYYLLFILGTFNRETTCFLTLVYLITAFGSDSTKKLAIHCGAQFLIWMAIKLFLFRLYAGTQGHAWHLGRDASENLVFLIDPRNIPYLMSIWGFVWIPVFLLRKKIPDRFVRRAIWIAIPLLLFACFVGNIYELRSYGEFAPLFLTAFLLILREQFGTSAGTSPVPVAPKK